MVIHTDRFPPIRSINMFEPLTFGLMRVSDVIVINPPPQTSAFGRDVYG